MKYIYFVLLPLVFHVLVLNMKVQAKLCYNSTYEEDTELENELKLLNKPAIKTIQSKHGDLYDCVDFYKQPGFDHPLLKDYKFDYKIQTKPTLSRKHINDKISNETRKPASLRFKGGGCPIGTVPIRRITKEDLIRERCISSTRPLVNDDKPGAHYAVIRTKPTGQKYNGAGGKITLHNPPCTDTQYSAARLKIQNGPDSIEVGWRVDPALYGDKRTRLYIRFDAGQTHCFNTRCPGFIIVNTEIPLDKAYDEVSHPGPGGTFFYFLVFLNRDLINGNWWLEFGDFELAEIGFWPARLFTGLSDWATSAEWGGEVYSPPGTIKPPMGDGQRLTRDPEFDAHIFECVLLDGKSILNADNVETFADSKAYRVADGGTFPDELRHFVLYGGPSGY